MNTVYSFQATRIDGESVSLESFKGQLLLIVNTASRCGFTPQYQGLESLYQAFKDQGFSVLGFPCNQFGQQEPGDSAEISDFCATNFGVSFPLFEKIDVNGQNAHPLFQYLKSAAPGVLGTKAIKWNFTKFLVGRDGKVIKRYPSMTTPESIRKDIQRYL
ncbi:glutathione peroxidase [Methylomonas methanica]|uniref:Glutathione peroxidase n=1 Tax=Methylomonas methanica (strain DSM 25384 / MC09) TaxID=857087 RepID=F9ZZT5_METMM|nr:glutathione peroxidase [Methylomonas methanica]AEF99903.1 Peroxiredoxin [Methylomonas methanica MC09]